MHQPSLDPDRERLPRGLPAVVERMAAAAGISDAELVRDTLAGDAATRADAFAALVARYQKRAFWVAFHVVGRVEDARDVVQEAFVRLYRSLDKYDYGRSFYTWFYRIVMNLAIDALRKQKSARAASLDDLLPGVGDPAEVATDAVLLQEQNGQVWQVLGRIDPKFRAVLVLRDIHGMSCREIAPILKITHATVRWRLHRGRQVFREVWERVAGGEER